MHVSGLLVTGRLLLHLLRHNVLLLFPLISVALLKTLIAGRFLNSSICRHFRDHADVLLHLA